MSGVSSKIRTMPVVGDPLPADDVYPSHPEPFTSVRCEFEVAGDLVERHLPGGIELAQPRLTLEFRTVHSSHRLGGRPFATVTALVPALPSPGSGLEVLSDHGEYVLARWCSDPSTVLAEREVFGFPTHIVDMVSHRVGGAAQLVLSEYATPFMTLEHADSTVPTEAPRFSDRIQVLGWKWITSAYSPGAADVDTLTSHVRVEDARALALPPASLTVRDPGPDFAPVSSRILRGLVQLISQEPRRTELRVGTATLQHASAGWTARP